MQQNGVVFPDLVLRTIDDTKIKTLFLGEPDKDDLFVSFSISVGNIYAFNKTWKSMNTFVKGFSVDIPSLKKLIQTYKDISQRKKDKMISFMKGMILSRRISVVRCTYLKKPTYIITCSVLYLILAIWLLRDSWIPIFQNDYENQTEYEGEIDSETRMTI